MHKGACIIASNSTASDGSVFDYIGLAQRSASLIRKHLKIPVAILTTSLNGIEGFDHVVRLPESKSSNRIINHNNSIITFPWDNDHRIDILDFSPFDRTLLLDADYLVLSDQLLPVLECDLPFMITDDVIDITGRNSFNNMKLMPDKTFMQRWATVMTFDNRARVVFDAARMVRKNYAYYATMFNFSSSLFRNDFVFSIATHLVGIGRFPSKLFQLPINASVESCNGNGLRIKYDNYIMRWNHDVHVLNKDIVINPEILDGLDA